MVKSSKWAESEELLECVLPELERLVGNPRFEGSDPRGVGRFLGSIAEGFGRLSAVGRLMRSTMSSLASRIGRRSELTLSRLARLWSMPNLLGHLPRLQPSARRLCFFAGLTLVAVTLASLLFWYWAHSPTGLGQQAIVTLVTPVATFTLPPPTITDVPQIPTATPIPPPPPTPSVTPTPGSPGADRAVAFNPGPGANAAYTDPNAILGQSDGEYTPHYEGILQLGRGGSVLVAFTDNVITDSAGPDLEIFGESANDDYLIVDVSFDGRTWKSFPTVTESSGGLDLEDVGLTKVIYVRITDLQPGTPTGAEVDAIVALHSGSSEHPRLPPLPDAVTRETTALHAGPDRQAKEVDQVSKDVPVRLLGRSSRAGWAKIETEDRRIGWCSVTNLALNTNLSEVPLIEPSLTSTPEAGPSATVRPVATTVPTPTGPKWALIADSRRDYPGRNADPARWYYLWTEGRNNFYWREMAWDDPNWRYKSPNNWDLRICQDRIQADMRGDVAVQWKAPQGGIYRFEWSGAVSFYKHLSFFGSQGPGTELAQSAIVKDVIDWELFFWVAQTTTDYHIRVYRLQE